MKTNLLLFLAIAIVFTSCVPQSIKNAADAAAAVWNVESASVDIKEVAAAGKEPAKTVVLHLTNPRDVPESYPAERIYSVAAMVMFQNMDKEDYKDCKNLQVILDKGGKTDHIVYELEKVDRAENAIISVTKFLDWKVLYGPAEALEVVDTNYIKESSLLQYGEQMLRLDSLYGHTVKSNIGGFAFDSVQDSKTPVVVVWVETAKEKKVIPYTFYVTEEGSKIVSVINTSED